MHFLLHKILKVHVHLRRIAMFLNKVEICGVNTSELPLLSDEEKENLFIQIEQGNMDAREQDNKFIELLLWFIESLVEKENKFCSHINLYSVPCGNHRF